VIQRRRLDVADSSHFENLRSAYNELSISYRAIDDFRTKLLGFLPLVTGGGLILLSGRPSDLRKEFFGPVGIFGIAVTSGLLAYELFGIRKCAALIKAGTAMERQMSVPEGQFTRRPNNLLGIVNEPFAAAAIYPAVLAAWTYLLLFVHHRVAGQIICPIVFAGGFVGILLYDQYLRKPDERLRSQSAQTSHGSLNMPYICAVTWTAKPGREGIVREALIDLAKASREESRNFYYQPYQDPAMPRVFRIFEVYQDEDAFKAHLATKHFRELGEGTAIPELELSESRFFQTLPTESRASLETHAEPARERGQRTYTKLFGHPRDMVEADGLAVLTIDHLFADVWSRSDLALRDRSMITIALLAAQGRDDELMSHLRGAMNRGLSLVEVEEILIHVAHYAGWASGHHAMSVIFPNRNQSE
jgi:alkylhydroperoxidase/carboxymuconolactone decarboxylase family protein YurZ/quinol monooxygenase YgiN